MSNFLVCRPVMVGKTVGKDKGSSKGQSGFGPLIKYPGYVDYNHPFFNEPFNKMPELAKTAGYNQGNNPCPAIPMPEVKRLFCSLVRLWKIQNTNLQKLQQIYLKQKLDIEYKIKI